MDDRHQKLIDATERLESGDPSAALDLLLSVWRKEPISELADVIESLGQQLLRQQSLLSELTSAKVASVFKKQQDDVDRVLQYLTTGTIEQARKRIEQLVTWPSDPRIDRYLVRLLQEMPYQSITSQKFWGPVFKRLHDLRDRSLLPQLEELESFFQDNIARTMSLWLQKKTNGLLKKLSGSEAESFAAALSKQERQVLKQLLDFTAERGGDATGESLLAAIHADPGDEAARLVCADWLQEQNDPHGELIALQFQKLKSPLSREESKREQALLKEQWKRFAGPIAEAIKKKDVEFSKGFVSACCSTNKQVRIREFAGNPSWATVERFAGSHEIYRHPVMRKLKTLVFDYYKDDLIDFCRNQDPMEVIEFQTALSTKEEAAALKKPRAMPRLQHLILKNGNWGAHGGAGSISAHYFQEFHRLCQSILTNNQRLRRLTCANNLLAFAYSGRRETRSPAALYRSQPNAWIKWLNKQAFALQTLELLDDLRDEHQTFVVLDRDEKGRFSRVDLFMDSFVDESDAITTLNSLDVSLVTSLTCQFASKRAKLRGLLKSKPAKAKKIKKAAERFKRLQSFELSID